MLNRLNAFKKNSSRPKERTGERFVNYIYSCRIGEKVSQEKLAKAVGVSRQTISAIENGKYVPSVYLALRLAQYFSTPIQNLFKIVSKK